MTKARKGRVGLDDRHEDLDGRIDVKRSDAINKNLSHPIPQFSPNATVGHMRKITGELGLKAIAKAAKKQRSYKEKTVVGTGWKSPIRTNVRRVGRSGKI
jgi:hypothetical protein